MGDRGCDRWQEAISATLDGEDPGLIGHRLDVHLETCGPCREFQEAAIRSRRALRLHVAGPMPDLSPRITRLVAAADRAAHRGVIRWALALVSLVVIGQSAPRLFPGDATDGPLHAARHLGAFTVAYGVGLLMVAFRPARARTMFPVALALTAALAITATIDLLAGRIPLIGEVQHLVELLSVVLVWRLMATAQGHRRSTGLGARRRQAVLRTASDVEQADSPPAASRTR